ANLEAANSRITDVDVAEESTQLARWNILVQSGTAMLAQANQSSQVALRLIQ
ncbi:MAG: flagellin, partial [Opitutae bacterium]|nr:flagellin [Opitutae bacterium]